MHKILGATFLTLATAVAGFSAGIPSRSIYGDYVEARTADVYTGPCVANAEVGLVGNLAVFGWKINRGDWHGYIDNQEQKSEKQGHSQSGLEYLVSALPAPPPTDILF